MSRKLYVLGPVAILLATITAVFLAPSAAKSTDTGLLETVTVPTNGTSVTSGTTLASGVTYQLRASGTFAIGCGGPNIGDAEYAECAGLFSPEDNCNQSPNDTDLGVGIDDADGSRAGRKQPFWGEFQANHVYTIDFAGKGAPIVLNYHDCGFGDNSGTLTVDIYGPSPNADSMAPAVSISIHNSAGGSSPDGQNGWFRHSVTVTVAADDSATGGSAIAAIDCGSLSLTSAGIGTPTASGSFSITDDGLTHVSCTASDSAGNTGGPATQDVPIDTTPPTETLSSTSCSMGLQGWCRGALRAHFDVTDATSGASTPCTAPGGGTCDSERSSVEFHPSEGPAVSITGFSACDVAGNCTPGIDAGTYKIDSKKPSITGEDSLDSCSLPGNPGWCRGTFTAGFKVTDVFPNSGLESPCTAGPGATCTFTLSRSTDGQVEFTFEIGDVCDVAGNCDPDRETFLYQTKIDSTPPTLAPTISPATILLHGQATATPNASDALSGIAAQSCDPVDTGTVGVHTLHCTATDKAGNVTTVPVSYVVEYKLVGFLSPTSTTVTRATTVAVAFAVADANGVRISDDEAKNLASRTPCRIVFAVSGAQSATACMTYYTRSNEFRHSWQLDQHTGSATISATVSYPGSSKTTVLSKPITIIH